jgi:hypothetical protein
MVIELVGVDVAVLSDADDLHGPHVHMVIELAVVDVAVLSDADDLHGPHVHMVIEFSLYAVTLPIQLDDSRFDFARRKQKLMVACCHSRM